MAGEGNRVSPISVGGIANLASGSPDVVGEWRLQMDDGGRRKLNIDLARTATTLDNPQIVIRHVG